MTTESERVRERMRQQYEEGTDGMMYSLRAWNELLAASTDMAFDLVLKNWNYSRSLRNSSEQAVEDAIKTRQRLSKEMLNAWVGYADNVKDMVEKAAG